MIIFFFQAGNNKGGKDMSFKGFTKEQIDGNFRWFIRSFVGSFFSFVRSFARSFIHVRSAFIHSLDVRPSVPSFSFPQLLIPLFKRIAPFFFHSFFFWFLIYSLVPSLFCSIAHSFIIHSFQRLEKHFQCSIVKIKVVSLQMTY